MKILLNIHSQANCLEFFLHDFVCKIYENSWVKQKCEFEHHKEEDFNFSDIGFNL
jgi:hypothetical protein